MYHSWQTSNFESINKKPPFIKVATFFWCNFSVKLLWLQRRGNKPNTTLFDRYYSQNCKCITFRKITNHTRYKQTNIPSHLHIFWVNFNKENHSFLHPFRLGGNRFPKNSTWSFDWGTGVWVKMHRFNPFSGNMNTINWKKNFPHMVEYMQVRENPTSILERYKTQRKLKKYERMYPWV